MTQNKNLNYAKNEILSIFNISSATLDNWIRTSIPEALVGSLYHLETIEKFIQSTQKLESRANKKKSDSLEYPKTLVKYLKDSSWVQHYLSYIQDKDKQTISDEIISIYKNRLNNVSSDSFLANLIPHNDLYSYSVAYQILLDSGEKSKTGAYYTPQFIVQEVVQSLVSKDKKYLEPCCGVGFYTLEYIQAYHAKFGTYPNGLIYANELDPISAEITRLNILQLTQHQMPDFYVSQGDGLQLALEDMDLVITNPPYGIKYKYPAMDTTEIFSHFIHKSLSQFLNTNGVFNFILPTSVLSVAKHKEIRKYILDNYQIEYIKHYGKSFDGVFSDVISLQIRKAPPLIHNSRNIHTIQLIQEENNQVITKKVSQQTFIDNDYTITFIDEEENQMIEQYYSIPHVTLQNCTFALGIVTGDNANFVFEGPSSDKSFKEIISGKEINKGTIDFQKKKYILDEPDRYQQKPSMSLFQEKKIIYKFISKEIVSAVDTTGILTLNSANLIVLNPSIKTPEGESLSEEYISAILNSQSINRLYQMKYGNPLKVLKKSLQELPIFLFNKEIRNIIIANYMAGKHDINNQLIEAQINLYLSSRN